MINAHPCMDYRGMRCAWGFPFRRIYLHSFFALKLITSNFLQAVMASDFSIAQFRFLERLLVVHGHWCYKRIAQMVNHLDVWLSFICNYACLHTCKHMHQQKWRCCVHVLVFYVIYPHLTWDILHSGLLFLLQKYSIWSYPLLLWGICGLFWTVNLWWLVHAIV